MKNQLKIFTLLAVIFMIGAATVNNQAQIKVGGYKKIAVSDAGVVSAAEFAAQSQGETEGAEISIQSIETAEKQTVAGANYKLCVEVFRLDDGADVEVREFIQTVVFLNLKKQMTVKSWEEVETCGAEE